MHAARAAQPSTAHLVAREGPHKVQKRPKVAGGQRDGGLGGAQAPVRVVHAWGRQGGERAPAQTGHGAPRALAAASIGRATHKLRAHTCMRALGGRATALPGPRANPHVQVGEEVCHVACGSSRSRQGGRVSALHRPQVLPHSCAAPDRCPSRPRFTPLPLENTACVVNPSTDKSKYQVAPMRKLHTGGTNGARWVVAVAALARRAQRMPRRPAWRRFEHAAPASPTHRVNRESWELYELSTWWPSRPATLGPPRVAVTPT